MLALRKNDAGDCEIMENIKRKKYMMLEPSSLHGKPISAVRGGYGVQTPETGKIEEK